MSNMHSCLKDTEDYFPKSNIGWNKIPASAKVVLVISKSGNSWWIAKMSGRTAVVFWDGGNSADAQRYLNSRQSEVIDLRKS